MDHRLGGGADGQCGTRESDLPGGAKEPRDIGSQSDQARAQSGSGIGQHATGGPHHQESERDIDVIKANLNQAVPGKHVPVERSGVFHWNRESDRIIQTLPGLRPVG
jgi:hypothetical protein